MGEPGVATTRQTMTAHTMTMTNTAAKRPNLLPTYKVVPIMLAMPQNHSAPPMLVNHWENISNTRPIRDCATDSHHTAVRWTVLVDTVHVNSAAKIRIGPINLAHPCNQGTIEREVS